MPLVIARGVRWAVGADGPCPAVAQALAASWNWSELAQGNISGDDIGGQLLAMLADTPPAGKQAPERRGPGDDVALDAARVAARRRPGQAAGQPRQKRARTEGVPGEHAAPDEAALPAGNARRRSHVVCITLPSYRARGQQHASLM